LRSWSSFWSGIASDGSTSASAGFLSGLPPTCWVSPSGGGGGGCCSSFMSPKAFWPCLPSCGLESGLSGESLRSFFWSSGFCWSLCCWEGSDWSDLALVVLLLLLVFVLLLILVLVLFVLILLLLVLFLVFVGLLEQGVELLAEFGPVGGLGVAGRSRRRRRRARR